MINIIEYLNHNSGAITAAATVVLVIATIIYVILTKGMLAHMVKTQNIEQRPYILVDFEFDDSFCWLVIRNTGKTPATNLTIVIKPEIINYAGLKLSETVFSKPTTFYPPGKTSRFSLKFKRDMLSEKESNEYEINIRYTWAGCIKPVQENYIINLENMKKWCERPGKGLTEIVNTLSEINTSIKSIKTNNEQWNPFNKLVIKQNDPNNSKPNNNASKNEKISK